MLLGLAVREISERYVNKIIKVGFLLLSFFCCALSVKATELDWQLMDKTSLAAERYSLGVHNGALLLIEEGTSAQVRVAVHGGDQSAKLTWLQPTASLLSPVSNSAVVSHASGVIAVGGRNGAQDSEAVQVLRWLPSDDRLEVSSLPNLPLALGNPSAVISDDSLYVVGMGQLYRLALSSSAGESAPRWQTLAPLPASAHTNLQLAVQNDGREDRLYAMGVGTATEALQLWSYSTATGVWRQAASRPTDAGNPAAAIAFGASHIIVFDRVNSPGNFYNAITDAWASYGDSVGAQGLEERPLMAAQWGDRIVLLSSDGTHSKIWSVFVRASVPEFGWVNMLVLTLYLLAMVLIGVYFMFKNNSTEDYFRGGQNIPWWAAACSIYATMLSSLTYVALPALVYRTDWLVYLGVMMILLVAPVAIYVAMPFFRQIDATSAYEYLSKRFNMPVRLLASGLFTLFHISRMGIVMALTALALAAVTPLAAWECVLVMGVLCLIYCTLGGVEAVIWTDTIQTIVLLIGALVCFLFILNGIEGGFSGFIERGMAGDKFTMVQLDFGPDSITSLAIWVIVLGGIGQNISSYTADQAVVQRYMVTTDERAAAKSIWANAIMAVPGALLFFCMGTGLYAFYQSHPEKLDPTIQIDQIFPAFIANELPIGIAGLIVAGIFAAAQSTVSTSMNSIATTLVTDFLRPFNVCKSEHGYFKAAQILTFLMGVLGTAAALVFISPEIRSLMEQYFRVIGMFMGALGGLFVLGVTTRKANGPGALVGLFTGVGVMFSVWQLQLANGYLFASIGIVTCLLVGYLASLLLPSEHRDLAGLTLYTLSKKTENHSAEQEV